MAASSSSASCTPIALDVYPSLGGFIGKLHLGDDFKLPTIVDKSKSKTGGEVVNVAVLDRSGSMGSHVQRIVSKILPAMYAKIDAASGGMTASVRLMAFDDHCSSEQIEVAKLPSNRMGAGGCTYMATAVQKLSEYLKTLDPQVPVRLLTLSDGEIHDGPSAKAKATALAQMVKERGFVINSQAVRYFSSSSQPDTHALSCLLQLSADGVKGTLKDIDPSLWDDAIADELAKMFAEDGFSQATLLTVTDGTSIFQAAPWKAAAPKMHVSLTAGRDNAFWLTHLPADGADVLLNGTLKVPIRMHAALDAAGAFGDVLRSKIDYFMGHLRVLKVVNSPESKAEIAQIMKYFTTFESTLAHAEVDIATLASDPSLKSRVAYYKALLARKTRSVAAQMAQIANDDRVSKLNAAQSADYLREVDVTKLSKGLARRAEEGGLDFDSTARREVRTMLTNIDQLKDVDDADHAQSFYSCETTKGGILALCELAKDPALLDELGVNEILRMLNIVGVPCSGPIGEYPDPMSYRVDKMFVGTYVSLSDVLQAHVSSGGKALQAPGHEGDITNVVPLFDDDRIHRFLRQHAPSLLEYTASIGMRRIIANIAMTQSYTVCAGLWKLVQDLDVEKKTSVHMDMFTKLCQTYKVAVGKYFDHLLPLITGELDAKHRAKAAAEGKPRPSYYLANNGITNMIRPLLELAWQHSHGEGAIGSEDIVAPILRALFTFETWQMVRKEYNHQEHADQIVKRLMYELLGLEEAALEAKKQPLRGLFEPEPKIDDIAFSDDYTINVDKVHAYAKTCWFVDYVTQLFPMLFAALGNQVDQKQSFTTDSKQLWQEIGKMSHVSIKGALGLSDDYDLERFRFFNVFQALRYTTKGDRVNDGGAGAEAAKAVDASAPSWSFHQAREQASVNDGFSRIIDVGDAKAADAMVREYVRGEFKARYLSELKGKQAKENQALVCEFVNAVLTSQACEATLDLFRNGVKRGDSHVRLFNTSSDAFEPLKKALLAGEKGDGGVTSPASVRAYALELLLLGRDSMSAASGDGNQPIVWNAGNVLLGADMAEFAKAFVNISNAAFARFEALKADYFKRNLHVYRGKPNRQGHSNQKPSFWALSGGRWQSLSDMHKEVSVKEYADYCALHTNCCGNRK